MTEQERIYRDTIDWEISTEYVTLPTKRDSSFYLDHVNTHDIEDSLSRTEVSKLRTHYPGLEVIITFKKFTKLNNKKTYHKLTNGYRIICTKGTGKNKDVFKLKHRFWY